MKKFLLLLLLGSTSQAALLLSDFNNLTTLPYVTADDGPWSDATAAFTPTTATIANFGNGTPSGQAGNGFIYWLGEQPQDWTTYNFVILTGLTLPENTTPELNFYIEDQNGTVSIFSQFTMSDFAAGNTTIALPIDFGGVSRSEVSYWGFQVNQFGSPAPAFGYSFDEVSVSAVPEPSTYMAVGLFVVLGLAARRLKLRQAKS